MPFTIAPKKVKYYSAIKNEQTFDIHNIGGSEIILMDPNPNLSLHSQ